MQRVFVDRESERRRLIEEVLAIRARMDEEDRIHARADAGDRLLREREAVLLGVTDWSEL